MFDAETPDTVKLFAPMAISCVTAGAALNDFDKADPPDCVALILHVPTDTGVTVAEETLLAIELDPTVQMDSSSDEKETVNPVSGLGEVASFEVAETVNVVPYV